MENLKEEVRGYHYKFRTILYGSEGSLKPIES